MRIAVLGGSFNPIHTGHLILASDVCEELHYDKVLFIPALNPPHKDMNTTGSHDPSPKDRLRMCQLAVKGDRRFAVEDCELKRSGKSYTYDTICFLEEKYKGRLEGKIGLIMGDDLLPGFHLWHRAAEIADKCDLILAVRNHQVEEKAFKNHATGQYSSLDLTKPFDWKKDPLLADGRRLENPVVTVSSTQIRAMASRGQSVDYLVPGRVFKYIKRHNLYL